MDKDVALAIRYAIDNGAKVINMSFGKKSSPQKKWVDEAVAYAEKHDVLIVYAAGNNGEDAGVSKMYPNAEIYNGSKAKNMISVGAIGPFANEKLLWPATNYSSVSVDIFAPGQDVYSIISGNQYKSSSGTSVAAPVVSAVAAMLFSYYPELTAVQVKKIIMDSAVKLGDKEVNLPLSEEKVKFSTLSVSGGVVNAYNAMQMAESYSIK